MPFLELSLTLHATQQASVEAALEDLGALSITLADADVNTPDERAIFEPGVGETPVWNAMLLQALFDANADRAGLVHALAELVPGIEPAQIAFRDVADQDWTRAWLDAFKPMRFGKRLWIYPWNVDAPDDPDAVIVRLDPGLAFGSGTHPTTALCLEWLDGCDLAGKTLIDYGCGSGILAIAALKLGAARAIGVDNDEQAIAASRDNAQRNGVSEQLDLYLPQQFPQIQSDVLVANILAGPLGELAPVFAQSLKSGGALALSGILDGQQDELLARYSEWFVDLRATERDGWIRIDGTRR
ncbi:MAG: 50S ribosomal protein L11 methyltransferase [Xanthomonadales bacterium PRO7]|jgi:ribosomal protein L11 methyltransferase|nr:50S ribosomal protein L11 methyltransferase [Xanthomonadales bacterium PRO7]